MVESRKALSKKEQEKWSYAILGGIVFLGLSLPCARDLVHPIAKQIAGSRNAASVSLIILTILYILIVRLFMW